VEICKTAPKSDIIVLVLTFVLTVVFDLVVAIEIGLLITVILFMKRMADVTNIRSWEKCESEDEEGRLKAIPAGTQVFDIEGPLFFATTDKFASLSVAEETKVVILRMRSIPAMDVSALRSLMAMHEQCVERGVTVLFSHVNRQPFSVIEKSGLYQKAGAENFCENIDAALKRAAELCTN